MRRIIGSMLALVLLCVASSSAAQTVTGDTAVSGIQPAGSSANPVDAGAPMEPTTIGAPAAADSRDGGAQTAGLPPPASPRAYVHVFLAFAIAFVLLGGYVVAIGRRFGRLEEEIGRQ